MTKLRFVLGDRDERYLKRLSNYITFHYKDRIEIYTFTELDLLGSFIEKNRINAVFVGKGFMEIQEKITPQMIFAYLSEGIETEDYSGIVVLMKYQSADALIKEMIALCSEQITDVLQGRKAGGKMILFESPIGGIGTTLAAAACACYFSRHGKKALYLNLEQFGVTNHIFQGEGRFDFSDIIYALKSKKVNLHLKFESIIRRDHSGTFFIEPCEQSMDLQSLTQEEAIRLIETLLDEDGYDALIIDKNSTLESFDNLLRKEADAIVLVADAGGRQKEKIQKFIHAMKITEERSQVALCDKLQILYNRYDGIHLWNETESSVQNLGRLPELNQTAEKRILERFVTEGVFETLL